MRLDPGVVDPGVAAMDPLVPVASAHDLHSKIKGSTLEVIEGMGHDLPEALWERLATSIVR